MSMSKLLYSVQDLSLSFAYDQNRNRYRVHSCNVQYSRRVGVALFNFEREFSAESNPVLSQAVKQSCEQQQRDVYESHRHRAFSLAFYMTGNEIEAEEILATTFVRAFKQHERPDGFAVDTALMHELGQRFPLREEEAPAVIVPGMGASHRNVRRPDLEAAVRNLPANER